MRNNQNRYANTVLNTKRKKEKKIKQNKDIKLINNTQCNKLETSHKTGLAICHERFHLLFGSEADNDVATLNKDL